MQESTENSTENHWTFTLKLKFTSHTLLSLTIQNQATCLNNSGEVYTSHTSLTPSLSML